MYDFLSIPVSATLYSLLIIVAKTSRKIHTHLHCNAARPYEGPRPDALEISAPDLIRHAETPFLAPIGGSRRIRREREAFEGGLKAF